MTSLYNRATPSQVRILRAVAGAVKNAADSHPNITIPDYFARSVAKRAAGTLTAGWPDVLAASRVAASEKGGVTSSGPARPQRSQFDRTAGRRRLTFTNQPSPLSRLHRSVGMLAGAAQRSGDVAVFEAYVAALRLIAKELERVKRQC